MKELSKDWITENTIDFEYKKYLLLAYLQEVEREFESEKIYPILSNLFGHYKSAVELKEQHNLMKDSFAKKIKGLDVKEFQWIFESQVKDDGLMEEINAILEFSIPQFLGKLDEGKKLYNYMESKIHFEPVGVLPINTSEGYLMLKDAVTVNTEVYQYQVTLFEQPGEKYRGLYTHHIGTYQTSVTTTPESLKLKLIKEKNDLPNPATFAAQSEKAIPLNESFLPIAKRTLLKYLSKE